eukprot:11530684-Alexandrium_andersonii.AAC.1
MLRDADGGLQKRVSKSPESARSCPAAARSVPVTASKLPEVACSCPAAARSLHDAGGGLKSGTRKSAKSLHVG